MTKSCNINQDENLIFYVLHSDFDNNIMPMQSLTSDQKITEKSRYGFLTEVPFEISRSLSFLFLMNDLDEI